MQIKISANNGFCRMICSLCGYDFKASHVIADAYVDGIHYGVVCEDCVKVGPEEIRKRMIERAQALRREAADIESLASQAIECPPWADREELERKIRQSFQEDNF